MKQEDVLGELYLLHNEQETAFKIQIIGILTAHATAWRKCHAWPFKMESNMYMQLCNIQMHITRSDTPVKCRILNGAFWQKYMYIIF